MVFESDSGTDGSVFVSLVDTLSGFPDVSTLMKAPDLFGAIGASLLVMAVVIYMVLSWGLRHRFGRDSK